MTYRTDHQPWLSCHWHCVLIRQLSPSETFPLRGFPGQQRHWSHDYDLELTPTGLGSPSNILLTDLRKSIAVINSEISFEKTLFKVDQNTSICWREQPVRLAGLKKEEGQEEDGALDCFFGVPKEGEVPNISASLMAACLG